ncbi:MULTISPECIES: DeoR/GlpR family DNA-binding transcription regulator [unclassified Amycolatopsis]|uniref:DeoR/GlpR family DNA-binding transcription regulator n=1 Tax=unclassified Amycolatopsis TaxID=2618356 RepID=UPI001FF1DA73|nr:MULTISPECIES: DeoR/GlpR family DNA-binding transcription regulator [unclassified Amycolatopsis]UOZ07326.1 DeoR/GlpR family DNA-binding transcription regulator [Amycolatopsis sp. WQ 127309]WSJ73574.1 DeoR/GlpR family DNA-binding transcription regulator [Amycolatopsis sp. NBC_01307]
MARHERLSTLLDMLGQREKIDVEDVAEELSVSAATIRRDLDHLAEQQLLTRTRGGAVANDLAYDLPLRYKTARHVPEKQRISNAAAAFAAKGMVVGLNGGTTTAGVARALAIRSDLSGRGDAPGITVVTNALNIAHELAVRPNVKIVVTGGVARPQSFELSGPLATRVLSELTIDLLFLGVDAFDPDAGAFAHHEGEASINRLMVERAERVVAVTDGSKLGRRAFARICETSQVHALVTDAEADPEVVRAFEAAGVEVQAV